MGSRSLMSCAAAGLAALFVASLIATGCGKGGGSSSQTPPPPASDSSATGGVTMPATSPYDAGPRAGEGAIDPSQVKKGELLFTSKGCTVCHGFGKKITCPDLDGVTMRRTAAWMEQQILHPEVMTKQDPIAHQLFVQNNKLQMTNQGLKPEEARAVIEFLKNKNRETAKQGK